MEFSKGACGVNMLSVVRMVGCSAIKLASNIGKVLIFCLYAVSGIFRRPFYFSTLGGQFINIGFYSLPVVGMTAIFTGAVLALQSFVGLSRVSAEGTVPTVVVLSITRELGPVLTGLMVAGRVGASIAAEIGTMKVTEQIDALYTLSTDPIKYLVTPRVVVSMIAMPILVLIADIIGVMGGYTISVYTLGFNPTNYISSTFKYLEVVDVFSGLVKAAVFGLIISTISCFCGYYSDRGAKGVGDATTKAVVAASVLILLSNYLITELFVK